METSFFTLKPVAVEGNIYGTRDGQYNITKDNVNGLIDKLNDVSFSNKFNAEVERFRTKFIIEKKYDINHQKAYMVAKNFGINIMGSVAIEFLKSRGVEFYFNKVYKSKQDSRDFHLLVWKDTEKYYKGLCNKEEQEFYFNVVRNNSGYFVSLEYDVQNNDSQFLNHVSFLKRIYRSVARDGVLNIGPAKRCNIVHSPQTVKEYKDQSKYFLT